MKWKKIPYSNRLLTIKGIQISEIISTGKEELIFDFVLSEIPKKKWKLCNFYRAIYRRDTFIGNVQSSSFEKAMGVNENMYKPKWQSGKK